MKFGNWLDLSFKGVRTSGKINMGNRAGVQAVAYDLGLNELVNWLQVATYAEYMCYLICLDYKKMPNFSSELIEELFATRNLTEKRALLEEEFGEIIAEYKADPHFDFKSFDATIDDVRRAKYVSVDGYVMAHASDTHPYHYLYPMQIGGTVVKLKGGIYRAAGGNIELLTVQTWHEEEQLADRLSPDGKRKFDQIHKLFRLQTLFM